MDFFSQVEGQVLNLSLFGKIVSVVLLPIVLYVTSKYYQNKNYLKVIKWILMAIIGLFYTWYASIGFPLDEALPLFHCRIGMFALLFLPDRTHLKLYFSLLGVSGATLAILIPSFYPYPLFHVTHAFFFIGHFSLLVLAHAYLLRIDKKNLEFKRLLPFTLLMNTVILVANILFHANYGFLAETPLIYTKDLVLNYLLVSAVIMIIVKITAYLYSSWSSK